MIFTFARNDYRINFWGITQGETEKRMKNADLNEKSEQPQLWNKKRLFIIVMTNDMPETMTIHKNILWKRQIKKQEISKQSYKDNIEMLHNMSQDQYRELSEEEEK